MSDDVVKNDAAGPGRLAAAGWAGMRGSRTWWLAGAVLAAVGLGLLARVPEPGPAPAASPSATAPTPPVRTPATPTGATHPLLVPVDPVTLADRAGAPVPVPGGVLVADGLVVAVGEARNPPPEPAPELLPVAADRWVQRRPVRLLPTRTEGAALTPDGVSLVYVSRGVLWTRRLDGQDAARPVALGSDRLAAQALLTLPGQRAAVLVDGARRGGMVQRLLLIDLAAGTVQSTDLDPQGGVEMTAAVSGEAVYLVDQAGTVSRHAFGAAPRERSLDLTSLPARYRVAAAGRRLLVSGVADDRPVGVALLDPVTLAGPVLPGPVGQAALSADGVTVVVAGAPSGGPGEPLVTRTDDLDAATVAAVAPQAAATLVGVAPATLTTSAGASAGVVYLHRDDVVEARSLTDLTVTGRRGDVLQMLPQVAAAVVRPQVSGAASR